MSPANQDELLESRAADAALAEAADRVGLDPRGSSLLRRGTNSVYRLGGGHVVARVAPLSTSREDVERQVRVARWLEASGVPAVELVDVRQPVEAGGYLVTFWRSVGAGDADDLSQYGSTRQLGDVLRKLHTIGEPEGLVLPVLDPWSKYERRLRDLDHLEPAERELLVDLGADLRGRFQTLAFALPRGPIHGDANVGNLLRTADGGAVLSDLDGFCVGPREWDLILTAMYADRYGWHTPAEYADFVDAYGWDVREWAGYDVLADVRELLMVLWNAGNAASDEGHREELAKRLETLRTSVGRDTWSPM